MNLNRREKKKRLKLKIRKRFKKCLFFSFILIGFILLIGFSYEKIGEYNNSKNYPKIGMILDKIIIKSM